MKNMDIARRTPAVAAILLGLAGLAGWFFDSEALKCIIPGGVAMQPDTAALLALCGTALLLICAEAGAPYYDLKKRSAFSLAVLAVLAGFLPILEYVYGFNLGLDQTLFSGNAGAAFAVFPERMAVATALCFMLTGSGILLADLRVKRWTFSASEKIALAVLLIAFHSLIGYLYVIVSGTLVSRYMPMAPHTAVAFVFLGLGLILTRPGGFVSIMSGRGIPRMLVLLTLPAAFLVLSAYAWLRLLAEKRGFYDGTSGVVPASVLSGAVLIAVILYAAKVVRKMGEDLHVTQFSVDNSIDAVLWSAPDGRILYANKAAGALLGYTREELLGLAISHEYSRLMDGGVEVSSRPGEGSTFKISVTMEEAGPADIAAVPVLKHVKALVPGQPPCRVLIADDKEDNRTFLSELLGMLGFETRAVADGAQALKEFEAWLPQVVLMDLRMPGMDGYESIKHLRSMEKGRQVKIIAISASAFTEVQQEAMASGADEFIAKPFREGELLEKIGKLTGVQYVYENQPGPATAAMEELLTAELFAGCPAELLNRIRAAALACDFDAITGLADQVEPVNLKTARVLRGLAQKYDSKSILETVPESKP